MKNIHNKAMNLQYNANFHIFDNLQEEVIVYDIMRDMLGEVADLRVKYINNASLISEIIPSEEVIDKTVTELYDDDVAALHLKIADEVLKSGKGKKYEVYFEPTDKYYSVSAYSSDDNMYIMISTDISELKKAEKTLQGRKELYKEFFNNPLNGFALCEIITDDKGEPIDFVYLKVNKAFEDFTGFKKEDVLNKKVTEVRPIEEIAPAIEIYGKVALTGKSEQFQITFPSLDKTYDITAFSPRKMRFIAMFTDITEQKKIEEELKKQADLLDLTRDAIIVRDMGDRVIFWNKGAEERYGWTREEAYGKVTYNLLKTEFLDSSKGIFNQLFQKGHWEGELIQTRRDGDKIIVSSRWASQKNENNEPVGFMEINTDISEHKKADEALKESEKKLRAIIDYSPDAIVVTDLKGNLMECNGLALNLFGFSSKEELIGFNTFDLIAPEDRARAMQDIEKTFSKGCVKDVEYNLLTPNSDIFPAELSVGIILDKNKLSAFVCVIKDITERKKTEKALKEARDNLEEQVEERTAELEEAYESLKENEEKFREIFNNANDMIALAESSKENLPGKYIAVNEIATLRLGYSRDEFLNMTPADIIAPERRVEMRKNGAELVKNGHVEFEIVHITKDGKRIPVEVNTHLFKLREKEVMLAISRDISNRKKAEEKLQFQADILKNVRDCVIVYDLNGKIIYWNNGAESIFGYLEKEMIGKNIKIIYLDTDKDQFIPDLEEITESGEYIGEWEGRRKDGSKVAVDIRETVMYDVNGEVIGIIGVSKDITERKEAEKALKDSEKQLRMITDGMMDMVSQADINGILQYVSPSHELVLGYRSIDLLGKAIYDFLHPDDLERVKKAVVKAFTTREPDKIETRFRHADGHYVWLEIVGNILFDGKHLIKGAVFGARDITKRKETEEQIKVQYSVLNGINKIFREALTSETEEEVAEVCLGVAEELTSSEIGFIGEVNDNGNLEGIALSSSARESHNVPLSEFRRSVTNMKIISFFGRTINEGKSQIVNDPGSDPDRIGIPEGHPIIRSFLGVPLKQSDKTTGLIALANKEGEYSPKDVENVESLSIAIVEALMSFRARNKLEEYKNQLEELVNKLRESETQFRTLTENSPNLIIRVDKDLKYIYTNSRVTEIIGKPPEFFAGKNIEETGNPEECTTLWKEDYKKVFETGEVRQSEYKFPTLKGLRTFKRITVPEYNDKGEIETALSIVRDITKRKQAENKLKETVEELKKSEDTLKAIIHGSPVLTFIINKDHEVLYWNKAIKEYSGLTDDEIVGTKDHWKAFYSEKRPLLLDLMLEKDIDGISKWYSGKCKRSKIVEGAYESEDFFPTVDKKERWLRATASAIKDSEGNIIGAVEIIEDITERKKAEQQLKEIIEELKRSNDELQRFAYVTSHDLQEPLRTIASFTQLLERRYKGKLDSDADEFMDYIVEASIRMKQMIQDLLDYSRLATKGGEFKQVSSETVLSNVLNSLRAVINENNAVVTHDGLPEVVADENQLARVFQNLIANAIKFKKEDESPKIHISVKNDVKNSEYVFSVADNGIGIEEQYFDRIFTIFQRLHTRDEYQGTGIGLSIVRKIIERHGGFIWVESEPGKGSKFFFTLAKP